SEDLQRVGAQIVGRRMFDFSVDAWGENPSFHAPVFVVTHRAHDRIEKRGGTSYTFVTGGIAAAIEQAKVAADGRDVLIAGGLSIAQRALQAGLVDELSMHITLVLLGAGARLLDGIGEEPIHLQPTRLAGSGAVTYVRYDVVQAVGRN